MTEKVAVVGSGYMGGGIGQVLVLAGYDVAIADVTLEAARQSRERLLTESRAFVADGLFPADATERLEKHLQAATLEDAVATASFIEEAVPERIDLKRDTLARISAAAPKDAVIGSNTSSISIAAMAVAVDEPQRFLGVHFSNPSPFIPGVELIPHAGTAETTVESARAIVAAVGKQSALVQDKTGFVLNRLQFALFNEAARVVEEGVASARDVDTVIRTTLGFRLPFFGPFAIADMAGLDTYALVFRSLHEAYPDRFPMPLPLAELVEQGHYGTKTGRGFLELDPERVTELVAYRNRAYVAMAKLLEELGPAPIE